MHPLPIVIAVVAGTAVLGSPAAAEIKKVPYPEVKVTVEDAYQPDAAFEAMHKAFADAVEKKDEKALFALVAPTFVWMLGGRPTDEFDMGRDALHNFKVVFGFRVAGKDVDGGVDDGPYWGTLADFAADGTYYRASDAGGLVCGPIAATIDDDDVFDKANNKLQNGDEAAEWYFTLADTSVAKSPDDKGAPVGKVGQVALPLLNVYPAAKGDEPAPKATHFEVLLPSGKSGFIPVAAGRPLYSDRLCYAHTVNGDWRLAAYDQTEQ
jgi:hypothetical protein